MRKCEECSLMKRYTGKELHEMAFFPALWRDQLTDFLSFFSIYSGIYSKSLVRIQNILDQKDMPEIYTDLCAGGGIYDWRFVRKLRKKTGRDLKVRLTDLYPSGRWKLAENLWKDSVIPVEEPLSAVDAIEKWQGLYVMFSGLHHFSPEELKEMIRSAVRNGRTLAFFDYSQRIWLLREFFLMIFSVPFMILTAPFVWPFSWKRLLFTWIIPVLPILLFIDGWLSRLRAYRTDELQKIAEEAGLPDGWIAGACYDSHFGVPKQVTCFIIRKNTP